VILDNILKNQQTVTIVVWIVQLDSMQNIPIQLHVHSVQVVNGWTNKANRFVLYVQVVNIVKIQIPTIHP
jgi:hypothetical protein